MIELRRMAIARKRYHNSMNNSHRELLDAPCSLITATANIYQQSLGTTEFF